MERGQVKVGDLTQSQAIFFFFTVIFLVKILALLKLGLNYDDDKFSSDGDEVETKIKT